MNIRLGCTITNHAGQDFTPVAYTVTLDKPGLRIYKCVEIGVEDAPVYYCDQWGNGWSHGSIVSVRGTFLPEGPEIPEHTTAVNDARRAVEALAKLLGVNPPSALEKLNNGGLIGDVNVKANLSDDCSRVNVKELAAKLRRELRRGE